ncbi:MAG: hypothetical protein ACYCT1_13945 [Steroidobacteraceae bacterium]
MIKSRSSDLRHVLLPDGKVAPLPPRAHRLFAFWTQTVSQATEYEDPRTLRCRPRPGRKPRATLRTIFFDIDTKRCPRALPTLA